MLFPYMPYAATALNPQGLFGMSGQGQNTGQNPFAGAELPTPKLDLAPIQDPRIAESLKAPVKKDKFLGSDEFYQGLLKSGAALLGGGNLGDALGGLGDAGETYRKNRMAATELVDPSKYIEATRDPRTNKMTYTVNKELQTANREDEDRKIDAQKRASEYQLASLGLKKDSAVFSQDLKTRQQAWKQFVDVKTMQYKASGLDLRAATAKATNDLRMAVSGASYTEGENPLDAIGPAPDPTAMPQGMEAPQVAPQPQQAPAVAQAAPVARPAAGQHYGAGIQSLAQSVIPGVRVTSGYRDPAHNAKVGGVNGSFHTTDDARDFTPPSGMSMAQMHAQLKAKFPGYDVINEGDHVHIEPGPGMARSRGAPSAPRPQGVPQRRMVARAPAGKSNQVSATARAGIVAQAEAAIAQGAPRAAVVARLKSMGVSL